MIIQFRAPGFLRSRFLFWVMLMFNFKQCWTIKLQPTYFIILIFFIQVLKFGATKLLDEPWLNSYLCLILICVYHIWRVLFCCHVTPQTCDNQICRYIFISNQSAYFLNVVICETSNKMKCNSCEIMQTFCVWVFPSDGGTETPQKWKPPNQETAQN